MKKLIALFLALSLCVLCGCGGNSAETEAPTTTAAPTTEAPTTVPPTTEAPATEAPTEAPVLYTNPLTGEALDAPADKRIVAVTINNIPQALPHYGVNQADLFFEMYVNDYATRGLALYSDITEVESVGSVRSTRYNFTDIAQSYDAFIAHAGGSDQVMSDLRKSGQPHYNVGTEKSTYYSFRDNERRNNGYASEHCLFAIGSGLYELMQKEGCADRDPNKTYGLCFTEDGTPVNGKDAASIIVTFKYKGTSKVSTLTYSAEHGQYIYTQYKDTPADVDENTWELFENVFVIQTEVKNSGVYHVANLIGSGDGYYACGGKIIPIRWTRETDTSPIIYTHADGTQLEQGIGSSYIAIVPLESTVDFQ